MNWLPLSVTTESGIPKRGSQFVIKALQHDSEEMSRRVGLRPAGKSVDQGKKILVSLGLRKWAY